ncbi:hypothetical protein [Arsenicicoccus bolidensis]|uniref:hypothetical protein n=1 Tax=Arsenicicoccus bolidensis TaxID=229480 RepID=UPI0012EBB0D1|nr:hypothetical protein [Arsenicicoccus bolidensis]
MPASPTHVSTIEVGMPGALDRRVAQVGVSWPLHTSDQPLAPWAPRAAAPSHSGAP